MYFSSLILYKENVRFFKFIFPIWKFQITIFEKVSRTFEILNSFWSFIFLGTVEGAQHFWLAFDKPNASKIRKFVSQNRPWRQGALIFQITNR